MYLLGDSLAILQNTKIMCGIIGYLGKREATNILLEGLKRMEYRGYDSAGVALVNEEGDFEVIKQAGRVVDLAKSVFLKAPSGTMGMGHTRWATHGGVTDENSHPHLSNDQRVAIVHNGVIENYLQLKKFLVTKGYTFRSQTDTEVLVNLIAYHYAKTPIAKGKNRLVESTRLALAAVEGTYGIVVMSVDNPGEMVAARKSSPLVVGVGSDEYLIASDVTAFSGYTANVAYLSDGQIAHVTRNSFSVTTLNEETVTPDMKTIDWKTEGAEMGDFSHFMEKEIFDQPQALENAIRGRFSADGSSAKFDGLNLTARDLRQIDRIIMVACGTAWHACLVGEYLIEKYARIPVEVDYASEFRYRNAPID